MTRSATIVRGKTRLTLLDLALDAATIRCLTDCRQDRAHGIDQVHAELSWGKLESSLDDIVAVGIPHKLFELLWVHHLLDHNGLGGNVGATDTLLNDIGAKFLLG